MRPFWLFTLAALAAAGAPAQFLPVGDVSAIVVSSGGAGTLLAGTSAGVFRSADGGRQWSRAGLASIDAFAAGPAGTVYAATSFGIAKSTDGGLSWVEGHKGCAHTIAVSPHNPSVLYADTCGSGILKSTDAGGTWTAVNNGMAPKAVVWGIAVDSTDDAIVFAATGKGIFKSTDAGQSWQSTTSDWTYCVAFDPGDDRHLLAGTSGRGVFESTDGGTTWTPVASAGRVTIGHLVIDAADPATIYAVTDGRGVLKSSDRGRTWAPSNGGLPAGRLRVLRLAMDPRDHRSLYAGTYGFGMYHSADGGATWMPLNTGLQSAGILAVAVDPVQSNVVYAGTDSLGVFRSADGGATWMQVPNSLGRGLMRAIGISAASPVPRLYVADLNSGVFTSPNRGETWARAPWATAWIAKPVQWPNLPSAIACDPTRPDVLYVSVYSAGIFKSADGGRTWTAINQGIENLKINSVILDPAEPLRLLAVGFQAIYRSDDTGENWVRIRTPFYGRALAIAPGVWYAGGMGMFKSEDSGLTWVPADRGLPRPVLVRSLAVDPSQPGTVYAGTEGSGLYKTTDGGQSWVPIGAPR